MESEDPQSGISTRSLETQPITHESDETVNSNMTVQTNETTVFSSIESLFQNEREDFMVNKLLSTSDYFLKKAHSLVLSTNTAAGLEKYYKMIKLSIQSLLMLTKDYKSWLNPQLESVVYFKLAKVYFMETENMSRADDYVNKAIALSTRNNLHSIKFMSEFLAAQIIQKTSQTTNTSASSSSSSSLLLSKYLDERVKTFKELNLDTFANLFLFLKISNLMLIDFSSGMVILQSLCTDPAIGSGTRALCLLYQSSMHLYRGSPEKATVVLHEVKQILDQDPNLPIQLLAMYYLQQHLALIQTANIQESKKHMHEISKFLLKEQENGWQAWREDGLFHIEQAVDASKKLSVNGMTIGTAGSDDKVSYQVSWLNSDEFVIMFYFLTGVNMLYEASNGKNKAKKVFKKCLDIIEKQLSQLNGEQVLSLRSFSVSTLSDKKIKLHYLRYFVKYYQVLSNVAAATSIKDIDWSPLDEFISRFNNSDFSEEESTYFEMLIPKIHYLYAIYFQLNGDLISSKKYFIKVCEALSESRPEKNYSTSLSQFDIGIGAYSLHASGKYCDVYVYSLLHILIIVEYELFNYTTNNKLPTGTTIEEVFKLRDSVYNELSAAFNSTKASSTSFNSNFVNSSHNLQVLYVLILSIYNQSLPGSDNHVTERFGFIDPSSFDIETFPHFDWDEFTKTFPIIGGLALYISWVKAADKTRREMYLQKFEAVSKATSKTSEHGKFLHIILLTQLIQEQAALGATEKASILQLELDSLLAKVSERLVET